jgi:hypothetical protein
MLSATTVSAVARSIVLLVGENGPEAGEPGPVRPMGRLPNARADQRFSTMKEDLRRRYFENSSYPAWQGAGKADRRSTAAPFRSHATNADDQAREKAVRLLGQLSTRLLPGRSGTSRVRGPSTMTKPGGSPRGEASGQPSASEDRPYIEPVISERRKR